MISATASKPMLKKLFHLRDDVVYLNHGSFGACPRPVMDTYQSWQLELERQPVEFLGRRYADLLGEARTALGDYLGAGADNLVYVPNASTGLNIVARAMPLEPGDEVLATDQEYGALDRTWRFVCGRRGARYVRQRVPLPVESQEQIVEAIWNGVGPRTKVLFVSHITSPTALILPVSELIRRARETGILVVIDGAHAPGQLPLQLDELQPDFYVGVCHKWMLSPKGAGFLYARPEVQDLLQPLVVSWGWEAESPGPSRFIDHHQCQGTRDIAAYLAVPAAIEFMRTHDWPNVRSRAHELALRFVRETAQITGQPALYPASGQWYSQMASCPLPPCDAAALQRELYDRYSIEIPTTSIDSQDFLRISVQAYNTAHDVIALIEALDALLPSTLQSGQACPKPWSQ